MVELSAYAFQSQSARDLRDLHGVACDLKELLCYLEELLKLKSGDKLWGGLVTASFITYRRCFKHGARSRISHDEVASLDPSAKEYHNYILSQADKLIAHSVNPFEVLAVGVFVHNEAVIGIAAANMRMKFDHPEFAQWHSFVSEILNKLVQPKIVAAEAAVLQDAQRRPVRDIIRAGQLRLYAAGPEQAGDRRED